MTFTIENTTSGITLGTYEADDASGALDAMARDGGYRDYADACDVVPPSDGEIIVTRI